MCHLTAACHRHAFAYRRAKVFGSHAQNHLAQVTAGEKQAVCICGRAHRKVVASTHLTLIQIYIHSVAKSDFCMALRKSSHLSYLSYLSYLS